MDQPRSISIIKGSLRASLLRQDSNLKHEKAIYNKIMNNLVERFVDYSRISLLSLRRDLSSVIAVARNKSDKLTLKRKQRSFKARSALSRLTTPFDRLYAAPPFAKPQHGGPRPPLPPFFPRACTHTTRTFVSVCIYTSGDCVRRCNDAP